MPRNRDDYTEEEERNDSRHNQSADATDGHAGPARTLPAGRDGSARERRTTGKTGRARERQASGEPGIAWNRRAAGKPRIAWDAALTGKERLSETWINAHVLTVGRC